MYFNTSMFSFNHNFESPRSENSSGYRVLYEAPIQTRWVVYAAYVLYVEAKIIIVIFDQFTSVPESLVAASCKPTGYPGPAIWRVSRVKVEVMGWSW